LVPEMGERAFGWRVCLMGITDEYFDCRTMNQGPPLALTHETMISCAREIAPAFFLDTAVRFIHADENKASEVSEQLATGCFSLLHAGARAIVCNHHSPKDSAGKPVTLENVLRGTGDFGAMADAVYGLRCTDMESLTIDVQCVKPRD